MISFYVVISYDGVSALCLWCIDQNTMKTINCLLCLRLHCKRLFTLFNNPHCWFAISPASPCRLFLVVIKGKPVIIYSHLLQFRILDFHIYSVFWLSRLQDTIVGYGWFVPAQYELQVCSAREQMYYNKCALPIFSIGFPNNLFFFSFLH